MTPDRVVYVVSRWGEPSQTFVRREAQGVVDRGVGVAACSLKPPRPCEPPVDIVHAGPVQVVVGLLRAAVRHPRPLGRVVREVLRGSSPRNVVPQLVAAAIGASWVGSRRLPPGHLHAQFGWVAATAAWAAASVAARPFSVMLHAFEIHDERYCDRFTPVPLRAAAPLCVESHRDRHVVAERWGLEADVVRLGVPAAWLDGHADDSREDDLVVSVGRLVAKKGYPVLLDALARTRAPWRLAIVGDGPLRSELEARSRRLGLADRVTFLGALPPEEVRGWLGRAAVSCLASVETADGDRDGTPMALVEAMARGAAIVSTDVGAIAELVGDAGVVVPPDDPGALADALDSMADAGTRGRLAAAARRRVADEWTADASARALLDLIDR